ncbi:MAG: SH3 domain-containing protein [Nitrosomonas sp.]|nr:SH3 domain-containing protein [Nitrosomonas sp.]
MTLRTYSTSLYRMTVILTTLITTTGCASLGSSEPEPAPITQEAFQLLQQKIERLEKVVQEKDAIILKQQKHQQQQAQAQQNTSHEAARTRLKLHRLATRPSTASMLAEVKVAINRLTQDPTSVNNQSLQIQAQQLFEEATRLYALNEYASSMNHAAQAYELISMAADKKRSTATSKNPIVTFQVPVILHTKTGVNLRKESSKNSARLLILEIGAMLTANAYQGNWLRVQTEDNNQGWVHNTLVETHISHAN